MALNVILSIPQRSMTAVGSKLVTLPSFSEEEAQKHQSFCVFVKH